MTYPRSPFDRAVADTLHWVPFIYKIRQHIDGLLPEEFAKALGHGVDGQFLNHLGLNLEQVTVAMTDKTDTELTT